VRDILEVTERVASDLAGVEQATFLEDALLQRALSYDLIVVGEAAARIPESVAARAPTVPWSDMRDMRNFLSHAYFRVDPLQLWTTVSSDLPSIVEPLHELVETTEPD